MADAFALSSHKKDRVELVLRRVLWVAILLLILFLIGEMIFHFLITPSVKIQRIEIKSDCPLTQDEVVALAGIKGNEYYFFINPVEIEARLKTHPLVKDAIVERLFPETLRLTLIGRTPLVVAYSAESGTTSPVVFDEEGILFEKGAQLSEPDIVVLSGIKLQETAVGTALARIFTPFLKDLAELKRKNTELYNLISEIRVVSTSTGGYELVLYPVSYPIRIWIGKRINAGLLRYMFVALNFMHKQGTLKKIDEADFRTGELVYRMKGEN